MSWDDEMWDADDKGGGPGVDPEGVFKAIVVMIVIWIVIELAEWAGWIPDGTISRLLKFVFG